MHQRVVAVAVLGASVCLACGSEDWATADVPVCEFLVVQTDRLDAELMQARGSVQQATADGDAEASQNVVSEIDGLVTELGGLVRDAADDADEDEMQARLTGFADELENFGDELDSGRIPDTRPLEDAAREAVQHCDESDYAEDGNPPTP